MEISDVHAKYYALELTKKNPSDSIEKLTTTLADARVDLNPHQIDAALFAFQSPFSRGAILADEVGLGKTIEAGIILSQKWAERKRRILIITPSSLRKQWYQELLDKFFLESVIMEKKAFDKSISTNKANPFEQKKIVICSYHFAWRYAEYISLVNWDLVVFDEAHKLRNVFKNSSKISNTLKKAVESSPKLLLTATPLQNSLMELYGLVSFVDEHVFGDIESFKSQFVRLDDEETQNYEDLKKRLGSICKRTLRRQVLEYIKYTNRIPITQEFTPTKEEQELYTKLSLYLQRENNYALPKGQRHLITLIMRKLLASSTFAIAGTLKGMKHRLEIALKENRLNPSLNYLQRDFETLEDIADEIEEEEPAVKELTAADKEGIQKEIDELREYIQLAESITKNAKGEVLQTALDKGFEKLNVLGAQPKALIFTEFKRTQKYIYERLQETEYKDKIVLFNGTNEGAQANQIYVDWLKKNQGTDKITSSASANKKAAIVDYFRDHAQIMIATEAAAEGINLQFCSLVVNYDLPWNPQRIEQRIGRCHRYGQQHDVVVVNFLNRKNEADLRIFELLSEKFKLFSGVFGASDQVLGAVESGIDFERRIVQIYQECRTPDEIKASFDNLQKELEEQINESMQSAKKKILENFDEEVQEKLRTSINESRNYINRYERYLWEITKHRLSDHAHFSDKEYMFQLKETPYKDLHISTGPYRLGRNVEDAHIYRMGHPLAQRLLTEALNTDTGACEVTFNYSQCPTKITVLEPFIGRTGELILWKINVKAFDEEEWLVFTGITDKGEQLDEEQCRRLFSLPGEQNAGGAAITNMPLLTEQFERDKEKIVSGISEKNLQLFDGQIEKLEKWASDKKNSLKIKLKELDVEIEILKKESRFSSNLQEKLAKQKHIRELEKRRDEAWKAYDADAQEVNKHRDKLIDEIETRMEQKVTHDQVFSIKWRVI